MSSGLKIAIIEPSDMIRSGLGAILRKQAGMQVSIAEIEDAETLAEAIRIHQPDILIVNPQALINQSLSHLREESACPKLKIVALLSNLCPNEQLRSFDECINLYDSQDAIRTKLKQIGESDSEVIEESSEEQQSLSAREKEIVVCVVKGMTNREIADRLFLSTHTVITHRRNIARKLQIHSPSGLTIYAIVNKLVELGEIKQ